jgi:hypothetical protein
VKNVLISKAIGKTEPSHPIHRIGGEAREIGSIVREGVQFLLFIGGSVVTACFLMK